MSLSAPYNFVPVSEKVCKTHDLGIPDGLPSQDDPDTGGLCGELTVTLTAETPILVAGAQDGPERQKRFFETPDGRAIQGSSIRGMIRNVIEIASFARMAHVENRRFGMRDLTPGARLDYGGRMSRDHGNNTYEARARGGWLLETDEGLFLEEVAYGRIEHDELFQSRRPQNKRTAMALEKHYAGDNPRRIWIENKPAEHPHSGGKRLIYRKAYASARSGLTAINASIVFTGMPNHDKHMEFAFPLPAGKGIPVSGEVWGKFLDVHENLEKPSDTWKHWRAKLREGGPIPVFFLLKEGQENTTADSLDQIGLSMMFKMAGENTTHDMMPKAHRDEGAIDLPTRMFGRIDKKHGSFRGRLSFGILRQTNDTPLKYPQGKSVILSSPKPSYFPSYVRQRDLSGNVTVHDQAQYRSYMNWKRADGLPGECDRIRGWKRYPQQNRDTFDPPEADGNAASSSHLYPLTEGAEFTGKIRFHNLHPIELGALLWALEWGGEEGCFHSLGMGKPFGWGRVRIAVSGLNVDGEDRQTADFDSHFTDVMTKAISGWRDTPQIKSLLAMARAQHGENVVGQMQLDDFRKAKSQRQVLPDIGFESEDLGIRFVDEQNLSRVKREHTAEEKHQLQAIEEAEASTGQRWVRKGDLVKARFEGEACFMRGKAVENQASAHGEIKVLFGQEIGVRNMRPTDLEVIE